MTEKLIDDLKNSLKDAKGEMQEYIADCLVRIANAPPKSKPEVARLAAQTVQLKAAEIALKQASSVDEALLMLVQIGLTVAAEQIREI